MLEDIEWMQENARKCELMRQSICKFISDSEFLEFILTDCYPEPQPDDWSQQHHMYMNGASLELRLEFENEHETRQAFEVSGAKMRRIFVEECIRKVAGLKGTQLVWLASPDMQVKNYSRRYSENFMSRFFERGLPYESTKEMKESAWDCLLYMKNPRDGDRVHITQRSIQLLLFPTHMVVVDHVFDASMNWDADYVSNADYTVQFTKIAYAWPDFEELMSGAFSRIPYELVPPVAEGKLVEERRSRTQVFWDGGPPQQLWESGWLYNSYVPNESPNFALHPEEAVWRRKGLDCREMILAFAMGGHRRLGADCTLRCQGMGAMPSLDFSVVDLILAAYAEDKTNFSVGKHALEQWMRAPIAQLAR
jgi:hypothetical protein